MASVVFDCVWQEIVRRQYASADVIDKAECPEISTQVLKQVAEFARLPLPAQGMN